MARMNNFVVGDEWICRQRPYMPPERVKVIGIEKRKQTTLPRPWNEVAEYDELTDGQLAAA